ncbi:MAG: MoxR family ATPase [Oligoflexia bacterium]|nr:MoxR family ATPase [Oligoflexia bacterium]
MAEPVNRIKELVQEIKKIIVGQEDMIQGILIGLFTEGHILIEGLPGLAKTLSVSTVAQAVSLKFKRVQFTPDLLPSDIIGTMVFNSTTGDFTAKKGPIFTNILLADEINRAPAKVQSALLEAMEERQVTIGENTYPLPKPFLVLATQNPIEQEGTFPLPEAQTDRFLFKIKVDYPTENEEMAILNFRMEGLNQKALSILSPVDIFNIQTAVQKVHIDKKVKKYIVDLVLASRKPKNYGFPELEGWIEIGASPRATVNFPKAIQALAFFEGRDFVSIDDVKRMALPILRHRLILSYEAQAEGITEEQVIRKILKDLEV